ncbi:MAG: 23S rRNA (pseudouridine(1915)-N(3))-methyltransferase RlmH [Gemmatimonadales bacterium]
MDLVILAVGRLRPAMREAADDYLRRLRRYAAVREIEVREASREPTVPAQREAEAVRLAERTPAGSRLVALAREGKPWTSAELARGVDEWRLAARPVTFVLGGSHGLAPGLLQRTNVRWSLGPLTLPHELARVVVLEQLYRAFTILRGEPYHKGS